MGFGLDRAIVQVLEDAGLGVYAEDGTGTLYAGQEPNAPDAILTVLLEGGDPPTRTVYEDPGFTIRTRDTTYELAAERARNVQRALQEFEGQVRGVPIARITANFQPTPLGEDGSGSRGGRWTFTQTFSCTTRRFAFT